MTKQVLQIRRLGEALSGYRVLASRKKPTISAAKIFFDAWIPELGPSERLWKSYRGNTVAWPEFKSSYLRELNSPESQNLLKPIALLSLRKPLVFVCDCEDHWRCPTTVLAQALEERRESGDFVLDFTGDYCHESRH